MAAKRRQYMQEMLLMLTEDQSSDSSECDSSDDDDDVELLLLETMFVERNIGARINPADISDEDFENFFRFQKKDFDRLATALELPEEYICEQGTVSPASEALMILLRRLAYPNRWCDLVHLFGRQEPVLSMIFHQILSDIYNRYSHLLDDLDLVWLDPDNFSKAIHNKGAPLKQCWGFIDGTAKSICRPIRNQRIMYSGHKRTHCIKFQSVIAPNGIICHLFGPMEGRRHDAFMLTSSGLLPKLEQRMNKPNGDPFVLYGDPAYPVRRHIIAPFRGAQLSLAEQSFNKDMSAVRTSVEWGYGNIIKYFAFLDFSKNLKVLLQPVGKLYSTSAILSNCHICLYGSQTGQFFGLNPPELETYLHNQ